MRGPRTPFSPERIIVPLPDTNPDEEEESLAGALERQGATVCLLSDMDSQFTVAWACWHVDLNNSAQGRSQKFAKGDKTGSGDGRSPAGSRGSPDGALRSKPPEAGDIY